MRGVIGSGGAAPAVLRGPRVFVDRSAESDGRGSCGDVAEQAIAVPICGAVVWCSAADADELFAGGEAFEEIGGRWWSR